MDLEPFQRHFRLRDIGAFYSRAQIPRSRRWWAIAIVVCAYLIGQSVLIAVYLPLAGLDEGVLARVFAGIVAALSVYGAFLLHLMLRNARRLVRIDLAARANGMEYADRLPLASFAGSVTQRPGRMTATDVVSTPATEVSPIAFTAATFQARPEQLLTRAGFVQIPLERPIPHIMLENRHSTVLQSTGNRPRGGQRLRLEGDFDRTFSLFCPQGYERDALYIFAPDLMAVLLDFAADCEIELVDGTLILYSGRALRLWRPDRFVAVHRVANVVGAAVRARTARYADDRAAVRVGLIRMPGVATAGIRLRTRVTVGTAIAVASPLVFGASGIALMLAR